jgi:hypothetical protein
MGRTGGGAGERTGKGSGMTDAPGPSASSAAEALAALEAAARVLAQTRTVLVIDWRQRAMAMRCRVAGASELTTRWTWSGSENPSSSHVIRTRPGQARVLAATLAQAPSAPGRSTSTNRNSDGIAITP